MRKKLFDLLATLYHTESFTEKPNIIKMKTLVIKSSTSEPTIANSLGWKDAWEIYCYSPNDIIEVDEMVNTVLTALQNTEVEIDSVIGDNYDEDYHAYCQIIKILMPKGVI